MLDIPAWFVDDAAAYDAVRDAVADAVATQAARADAASAQRLTQEALSLDPFERSEVDGLLASLAARDSSAEEPR